MKFGHFASFLIVLTLSAGTGVAWVGLLVGLRGIGLV